MSSARPLTGRESAVLSALLAHDFDGAELLRAQAANVLATPGCDCGCGTIDLLVRDDVARRPTAPSPVPVEATISDESGTPVGGVLLFLTDGLLTSLEVYSLTDDPLSMPEVGRLAWKRDDRE